MDSQVYDRTSPDSFIPQPPKYKRVSSSSSIVSKNRRPVSGNSVKFKTENGEILKPNYTSDDTDVNETSLQRNNIKNNHGEVDHSGHLKCTEGDKVITDKSKRGADNSDADQTSQGDYLESGKSSKCSNFEDSISLNKSDRYSGKEDTVGLQFRNFRRPTVTSDHMSNKTVENGVGPKRSESPNTTNGEQTSRVVDNISSGNANTKDSLDIKTEENVSNEISNEAVVDIDARERTEDFSESKEASKTIIEGDDPRNELNESKESESSNFKISQLQSTDEDQNNCNGNASSTDSKVNITPNMQLVEGIDMHNNSECDKYPTGNEKASTGNERENSNTQEKRNSILKHQKNEHDVIEVIDNEPSTSASDTAGPNPIEVAIWMKRRAMMRRRKKRRIYTTDVYETDGQMSNQGYMDKPQGEAAEKRKVRNQILKRRLSLAVANINDGKEVTKSEIENESENATEVKLSEEIHEGMTDGQSKVDVHQVGDETENQKLSESDVKGNFSEGNETIGNTETKVVSETDVRESDTAKTDDIESSELDSKINETSCANEFTDEKLEKDDRNGDANDDQTTNDSSTSLLTKNQIRQENEPESADTKEVGEERVTLNTTDTSTDNLKQSETEKGESNEMDGSCENRKNEKNEENYAESCETKNMAIESEKSTASKGIENFQNVQDERTNEGSDDAASHAASCDSKEQTNDGKNTTDNVKTCHDVEKVANHEEEEKDNVAFSNSRETEISKQNHASNIKKRQKTVKRQKEKHIDDLDTHESKTKSKTVTRAELSSSEMESLLSNRRDNFKPKKKTVRHKSKKMSASEEMASSSDVESHEELSHYKQRSLKDLCKELRLVRRAISELYDESKKRKRKEHRKADTSKGRDDVLDKNNKGKTDQKTNAKDESKAETSVGTNSAEENKIEEKTVEPFKIKTSVDTNASEEIKSNELSNQSEPENVTKDELVEGDIENDKIFAKDSTDKDKESESSVVSDCGDKEGKYGENELQKENQENDEKDEFLDKENGVKVSESESDIDQNEKDVGPHNAWNNSSTGEEKEVLDANKNDTSLDAKGITRAEETDVNDTGDIEGEKGYYEETKENNATDIEGNNEESKAGMNASIEIQAEKMEEPSAQDVKVGEENDDDYDSSEEKDDREDDCSLHVSRCESVSLQVEGRQGTRVTESDMDSVMWKDDDFQELRSSTSDETISIVKDIVDDLVKRVCDFPDHRTHKKELRMKKDDQDEIFCIVYCDIRIPGFAAFADSLSCVEEDLMTYSNMVPKYGNLMSPVLSLHSFFDSEVPGKFTVRVPFTKASMRHYQTPVFRSLSPEMTWQDIRSEEYMYEDDDGCIIPVLEAEMGTLAPMAVVAMPIIETFIFDGNVREVCSCVDPGIVISSSFSPRFNSVETIINLTVLPISSDVIDDSRYSRAEDAHLLASTSSLIKVDLLNDPPQAVTLYLPCEKPKSRPWTAQMSSRLSTDSGFSTSRIKSRAKSREAINNFLELWYEAAIYLVRIANGNLAAKETRLKNRDVTRDEKVVLTCHEKTSTFLIVETKKEAQHPNVNSIANNLLYHIETQRVVLCVLQKKENVRHVTILCALKSRLTSRMQLRYERDHYIKRAVFSIKEGDLVKLSFRGNIANVKNEVLVTRFYAVHGLRVDWNINVVDIYAQRSLPSFCGFLQLHSWNPDESMAADTEAANDDSESWSRVIDVPITLPKYKSAISSSIIKIPLHLRNEGPISVDFLMSLAKYIGYEWYHLARALHIDHARVQSIVQQNRHQVTQKLVSDLLLTWMKRSPHGVDKAHVLVKALRRCGRGDLADEIKDIDKTFKRDLHKISYEKRLSKAIETTASSPVVVQQWRRLSSVLGVREKTIASISSTGYDDKRKCMAMLAEWRKSARHRTHRKLVGSLRQIGCNCVADHLVSSVVLRPKTSL